MEKKVQKDSNRCFLTAFHYEMEKYQRLNWYILFEFIEYGEE